MASRNFVRELQRRDRLEERVGRAAEETCLLAGEHGDRPGVSKLLAGGGRLRRCAPAPLLPANGLGQLLALTRVRLRAGDGRRPGGLVRWMAGKERREAGERKGVVCGETFDPGKTAQVDACARGRIACLWSGFRGVDLHRNPTLHDQLPRISATMKRLPEESSLHTEVAGSASPDAFGPFRVLHQIGAGTLGPVFRAYEPDRDRLVAIKLFRLDLPPERVHQLVGEFEQLIAAGLDHPVIAAPLAAGIEGVTAYLAQDYVTADSLDIVIREGGPASVSDAVGVATRLAEALDFAADNRILHGALHPRDVLLSSDDFRVTGLGVARALERVGVIPPVRRPYTAPERVGGGAWDRRADVFSLAAVMHELIGAGGLPAPVRRRPRVSARPAAETCWRCATCSSGRSPRIWPIVSRRRRSLRTR